MMFNKWIDSTANKQKIKYNIYLHVGCETNDAAMCTWPRPNSSVCKHANI